jgi:hypothetical protein
MSAAAIFLRRIKATLRVRGLTYRDLADLIDVSPGDAFRFVGAFTPRSFDAHVPPTPRRTALAHPVDVGPSRSRGRTVRFPPESFASEKRLENEENLVERMGIEPTTFALRTRRSPS